ncbi:MAG: peptidylprolyl isomerase [Deltaproteobacteria bacterium]|nr:peptidylprolyl isomerase [Deltaproteobacteria bacterium]
MSFFKKSLLALTLLSLFGCSRNKEGPALAEIGDQKITLPEFLLIQEESGAETQPSLKKQLLQALIDEKLLLGEAKRQGVTISNKEWSEKLKESGPRSPKISLSLWRERQRGKLILAKWLSKEIRPKLRISEDEVQRAFHERRSELAVPEQVRARQITVSSREKAEKILALIKKGENFVALAQQYSESPDRDKGGDLGFFSRGSFPKVFEETCFKLPVGEVSPVIPSEYGFHVFKVVEKRRPQQPTLEEAKKAIIEKLLEEKEKKLMEQLLADLRKNVPVVLHPEADSL